MKSKNYFHGRNLLKKLGLFFIVIIFSCCSSKYNLEYKGLNLSQLKSKEIELQKQLSYYKFEYYLMRMEKGKGRYSLAIVSDENLKTIMEKSPNDKVFWKEWKDAVNKFSVFEEKNSPEIKEHRINYRQIYKTKKEHDDYYDKYYELTRDLKLQKTEEYIMYHEGFTNKLNDMWLNRGRYLLAYHKSENLLFPIEILTYKDYDGISEDENYLELTQRIFYLNKKIRKYKR